MLVLKAATCSHRRAIRLLSAFLLLALSQAPLWAQSKITPANFEAEWDNSCAGPSGGSKSGSCLAETVSVLNRTRLTGGWYGSWGVQADRYAFSGAAQDPAPLTDVAAQISAALYREGEPVAGVQALPGWYFEKTLRSDAWDIPVNALSGIPLRGAWNAAIGFSSARFYHHPLPIFGLVWDPTALLHVELMYPEPAVTWTLRKGEKLKVGGELLGGGYLAMPSGPRSVIEFSSYRVGVTWSRNWTVEFESDLSAGWEVLRDLDYFKQKREREGPGGAYVGLSLFGRKR